MTARARTAEGVFDREAAAAAKAAGLKRYISGRPCPAGHVGERFVSNYGCVECLRGHARNYYAKNLPVMQKRSGEWARKNPEKNAARARRWYHARVENKAYVKANRDQWRQENVERTRLKSRLYSQARRKRLVIPAWADLQEIERIYVECPPGMEVDHIVPIAGKNVCGLHVEYNLQYLTKSENSRKGAKHEDVG